MSTAALWLWLVFGILAFGLRVALHMRRTGETGLRGVSGRPWSVKWLAGVGFVTAIALGVAAPILALTHTVEPIDALDTTPVHVIGLVFYGLGLATVLVAQAAMGRSWRVGVDPAERTALVTDGPFLAVRNPIFTAMLLATIGLALLVPSVVSILAVALLLTSLELHTRIVEEPYLMSTHGERYSAYASRVGRFLPGVGRLRRARGSNVR